MKKQYVTAANSYIPIEPSIAGFATTYLPADFQHRLALAMGIPSEFITGIDIKGRYASRSFLASSFNSVADFHEHHRERFQQALDSFNVVPSRLVHTDHQALPSYIEHVVHNLKASGAVALTPSENMHCNDCSEELSKSEVRIKGGKPGETLKGKELHGDEELCCLLCGGDKVQVSHSEQWTLNLSRTEKLKELVDGLARTKTLEKMVQAVWDSDFEQWTFSRDKKYNGSRMPGDSERVLYLWFDSLVSKFLPADPSTPPEKVSEQICGQSVKSFFGRAILPYYSLVFPSLLQNGYGADQPDIQLCSRGYCHEDEAFTKLNKDLPALFKAYDVDEFRFYCAYTVNDDVRDFKLTENEFQRVNKNIFHGVFTNFLTRAQAGFTSVGTTITNVDFGLIPEETTYINSCIEDGQPRKALLYVESMALKEIKALNKGTFDVQDQNTLVRFALIAKISEVYAPTTVRKLVPGIENIRVLAPVGSTTSLPHKDITP